MKFLQLLDTVGGILYIRCKYRRKKWTAANGMKLTLKVYNIKMELQME